MLRGYFRFKPSSVFKIKLIPRYFEQPRDKRCSMRALILFFEDMAERVSSVLLVLHINPQAINLF